MSDSRISVNVQGYTFFQNIGCGYSLEPNFCEIRPLDFGTLCVDSFKSSLMLWIRSEDVYRV